MEEEIKRGFYLNFYPVLYERFIKRAYTKPSEREKYEVGLVVEAWDKLIKGTNNSQVTDWFAGTKGNCPPRFFYTLYLAFLGSKNGQKPPIKTKKVDRLTFIKALVFIGMGKGISENIFENGKDGQLELNFDTLQDKQLWRRINSQSVFNKLLAAFEKIYPNNERDINEANVTRIEEEPKLELSKNNSAEKLLVLSTSTANRNASLISAGRSINDYLYCLHNKSLKETESFRINSEEKDTFLKSILKEPYSNFEINGLISLFIRNKFLADDDIIALLKNDNTLEATANVFKLLLNDENNTPKLCTSAVDLALQTNNPIVKRKIVETLAVMHFDTNIKQFERLSQQPEFFEELTLALRDFLLSDIQYPYTKEAIKALDATNRNITGSFHRKKESGLPKSSFDGYFATMILFNRELISYQCDKNFNTSFFSEKWYNLLGKSLKSTEMELGLDYSESKEIFWIKFYEELKNPNQS